MMMEYFGKRDQKDDDDLRKEDEAKRQSPFKRQKNEDRHPHSTKGTRAMWTSGHHSASRFNGLNNHGIKG